MKHRKQRSDKGKPRGSYKENISVVEPLKEEMENYLVETPQPNKKELTYEDLPESIKRGVKKSIEHRKLLNLADDSEDRKARAIKYYKWQKEQEGKNGT